MNRLTALMTALLLVLPLVAAVPVAGAGDARVIGHGTFEGRSGHSVSGTVEIVATASGHEVVLGEDFRLDSAPDPHLALGRNGYVADTQFAALRHAAGRQAHALPADLDPRDYTEVWLWCEAFGVPLGVAVLAESR